MISNMGWTNQLLVIVLSLLTVFTFADDINNHPQATTQKPTPVEDYSDSSQPDQAELIAQCHMYAQSLMTEKERLRAELDAIKARMEAVALQDMEEEADDSNESHSRSRGIRRSRRGTTSVCEGGTVSQWACGSQCIYKLKGLCGLSLRAMCHC